MFVYPEAFVKSCKEVYPDWVDLHMYLDKNAKIVGRMLEDAVGLALDEDMIISLFRNKKEHKILEAAKRAQAKRNIYRQWVEVIDAASDANAARLGYDL